MSGFTTKRKSYFFEFDESNHQIIPHYATFAPYTPIWLSSHKLAGFENVVGQISRDHYVLCVVYYKNGRICDTQLGITGSLMKKAPHIDQLIGKPPGLPDLPTLYENIDDASVRECAEELGLFLNNEYLENTTHARHISRKRGMVQQVYTSTVNIKHCTQYDPDLHECSVKCTEENGWTDDRSQKVQILVHGELEELIKCVKGISHRIPSNDLTSIRGIRLMHQQDVYSGMKFLNRRKN